ncbi:hypothetical protein MRX96_058344 [Rhipicephalus microplus]
MEYRVDGTDIDATELGNGEWERRPSYVSETSTALRRLTTQAEDVIIAAISMFQQSPPKCIVCGDGHHTGNVEFKYRYARRPPHTTQLAAGHQSRSQEKKQPAPQKP